MAAPQGPAAGGNKGTQGGKREPTAGLGSGEMRSGLIRGARAGERTVAVRRESLVEKGEGGWENKR